MNCCHCPATSDLRPYGPKGAMICFDCMKASPEREDEAKRQFGAQLNASGPVAVLDGTSVGPYPLEHHPDAERIAEIVAGLEPKP